MWDPKETIESVGLGKRERKRSERVADVVQKELSMLFLQKVRDEKLSDVTITNVLITDDLRSGRIFYVTHGDEKERRKTAAVLSRATGFVRSHIAKVLNLRHTPTMRFEYDLKADKIEELDQIFDEIARERKTDENNS